MNSKPSLHETQAEPLDIGYSAFPNGNKDPETSAATYLRKMSAQFKTGSVEANPPCNGCTACCRNGYDICAEACDDLTLFTATDEDGKPILPKDADGACAYLSASGCSVYNRRPLSCRAFDCRRMALTGFLPANADRTTPPVNEAVRRWDVSRFYKTYDDRMAGAAVKLAVPEAIKIAQAQMPCVTAEHVAVFACTLHEKYLHMARRNHRFVMANPKLAAEVRRRNKQFLQKDGGQHG